MYLITLIYKNKNDNYFMILKKDIFMNKMHNIC